MFFTALNIISAITLAPVAPHISEGELVTQTFLTELSHPFMPLLIALAGFTVMLVINYLITHKVLTNKLIIQKTKAYVCALPFMVLCIVLIMGYAYTLAPFYFLLGILIEEVYEIYKFAYKRYKPTTKHS